MYMAYSNELINAIIFIKFLILMSVEIKLNYYFNLLNCFKGKFIYITFLFVPGKYMYMLPHKILKYEC